MSKTIKKVTAVALGAAALTIGAAQTANADTVALNKEQHKMLKLNKA